MGQDSDFEDQPNYFSCVLRRQSGGGHLFLNINTSTGVYRLINHTSDSSHVAIANGNIDLIATCGGDCVWAGSPANGETIGVTIFGTGTNTSLNVYDSTTSTLPDPQDPNTWTAPVCVCSAAEIAAATFVEIDAAGGCGPEAASQLTTESHEIKIDDFACGDIE
jgi:hypothetical protein